MSTSPDYITLEQPFVDTHRKVVEDCLKGQRLAQRQLYDLYAKAMYNLCLRMMGEGRARDAEDLLQDVFVEVFAKLPSFRFECTIGAWIKRIAVNRCINHLKKRHLLLTDEPEPLMAPSARSYEMQTDEDLTAYHVSKVKQSMMALPDGYRVVFSMFYLEGFTHDEISEVLGVSENTSKSQLNRAKNKLREMLKNQIQ